MILTAVIPTLGRKKEVDELLNSLESLTKIEHEILIIDQNFNNLLDTTVHKYSKTYNIKHYKVDFRSLSKAKNFGVRHAIGEYICFFDDDSKLFNDTISFALQFLQDDPTIDIVFGKCIDNNGNDSVIKFGEKECFLSLDNFEGKFIEATMCAKTKLLKENTFDENLGIGAFFGAEEGYDLIFRLLKKGYKLFYSPNIRFYHPQAITDYSDFNSLKRVFEYRKGFSYVCRKHKLYKKLISRIVLVGFGIPFYMIANRNRARYYFVELLSLLIGAVLFNKKRK